MTSNHKDILHLISLNTQGIRNGAKRARLREYIIQQKANIVFLQETHFTPEIESVIKNEFLSFEVYNSYGNSASRGCTILIEKKLDAEVIDFKSDQNGRYVLINLDLGKNAFSMINLYAPNELKLRNVFFTSIDQLLKQFSLGIKLIAGDYNQTLTPIDRISRNKRCL